MDEGDQTLEPVKPFYDGIPELLQCVFERFAARTGRAYRLFDYYGHLEADRVMVAMASAPNRIVSSLARAAAAHVASPSCFRALSCTKDWRNIVLPFVQPFSTARYLSEPGTHAGWCS
jgi:hypothetical protein